MQYNIDLVPDLAPTILAARQLRDARNSLQVFLPVVNKQAVSYRLGRRKRLDQTVPIRALDAPAVPIRRPGVVEVRGDLPAITPIVDLSEQDLTQEFVLAQQLAGLQVDYQEPVTSCSAIVAVTVENTYELMRGQVLSTCGILLESADGSQHEVDYEVSADNKITVNDPWTPEDPQVVFADFRAAAERFLASSGNRAGIALTTSNVELVLVSALQALRPQQSVDYQALAAYLAVNKLPQIVTYDRLLEDQDGNKTRVYPEGHMTLLPTADGPVGQTEVGVTQEAVRQVQRRVLTAAQAPGLTIITLANDNPVQLSVKGASLGMPVLHDNEDIVVIKGLLEAS